MTNMGGGSRRMKAGIFVILLTFVHGMILNQNSESTKIFLALSYTAQLDTPDFFKKMCLAISPDELLELTNVGLLNLYQIAQRNMMSPFFQNLPYLKIFMDTCKPSNKEWTSLSEGTDQDQLLVLYAAIPELDLPSSLHGSHLDGQLELLRACKTDDTVRFLSLHNLIDSQVYNLAWKCALKSRSTKVLGYLMYGIAQRIRSLYVRIEHFEEKGHEAALYVHQVYMKARIFFIALSQELVADTRSQIVLFLLESAIMQFE